MNYTADELAPAVRGILDSAAERDGGEGRLTIDPRSLPEAFAAAESEGRVPIIAEVKPTSPTTEGTNRNDPVDLAKAMVEGGAAALSVLTEPDHFGGSVENLERIRAAVDVPVLRKDFLLREAHLDAVESDVILLIARFLGDDLEPMLRAAEDRGFQPLVEVHTEDELDAAVDAGASIIGINNRDLGQLEVDLATFEELAPQVPDDVTLIAESGVSTVEDVQRMGEAGADGLLIGTAIMDGDPQTNTERFTRSETQ
ncbi:indole-3-glycerol phosphate synthase [Halohasta litchfieldiae]|jgi:indole-3-glycerol phosphate synthase|uniref:Indole-3-glycerol phosphate synthase n=1 Tax=Halohasta litchfieldiae TaxID=1073996 RepID=A0A1H6UEX0_9EURY|nr:indole-3-glycerol phosphate synthase [Halohasta litchfieldiae]ATW87382.1 indole-3-glycerol phosphate synthase [Halohasta litchfieldiae]SEI90869.1 indole-3-glycerol phosphate synthase [Halohasta litchfieldiae]